MSSTRLRSRDCHSSGRINWFLLAWPRDAQAHLLTPDPFRSLCSPNLHIQYTSVNHCVKSRVHGKSPSKSRSQYYSFGRVSWLAKPSCEVESCSISRIIAPNSCVQQAKMVHSLSRRFSVRLRGWAFNERPLPPPILTRTSAYTLDFV